MLFRLEPNSGVPLYRQIVAEVQAAVVKGTLREGDRLPSVRELARSLGINPTTVVKAYDELARERLVVQRQGLGAFVTTGREAMPPAEREERIEPLATRLAVEGRRLGYSEARLLAILRRALGRLRPASRSRERSPT